MHPREVFELVGLGTLTAVSAFVARQMSNPRSPGWVQWGSVPILMLTHAMLFMLSIWAFLGNLRYLVPAEAPASASGCASLAGVFALEIWTARAALGAFALGLLAHILVVAMNWQRQLWRGRRARGVAILGAIVAAALLGASIPLADHLERVCIEWSCDALHVGCRDAGTALGAARAVLGWHLQMALGFLVYVSVKSMQPGPGEIPTAL